MRILVLGVLLPVVALAGCSRSGGPSTASAPAERMDAKAPDPKASGSQPMAPVLPQLAYSYQAQVEAGAAAIPDLLARHEAACLRAGPALCQVTGAERTTEREGARAELRLRAQPAWLQAFGDAGITPQ